MVLDKQEFLEALTRIRREKGLTQGQLSKLTGLSLKTVSNVEKGNFISAQALDKIAKVLKVEIKKFIKESFVITIQ
jgi:transcriptional regulator with XRE-family HTH domain